MMKKKMNVPKIVVLLMHTVSSGLMFFALQDWAFQSLDLSGWVIGLLLVPFFVVVWLPVLGAIFMASVVYWFMDVDTFWVFVCLAPMVAYCLMVVVYFDRLTARSRYDSKQAS